MNNKVFHLIPASSVSLWTFAVLILMLIVILVVFARFVYWSKYTTYEITDAELIINGGMWSRTIGRDQLNVDSAEIVNAKTSEAFGVRVRTTGIAIPGYKSGWFRLKNDEKALLFVTDQSKVIRLPTFDGYTLMMTVDEPEQFLAALR